MTVHSVSDRKTGLRARAGDALHRWKIERDVAARARQAIAVRTEQDPERLERIAVYARSGYFQMTCSVDMFSFTPEVPLS